MLYQGLYHGFNWLIFKGDFHRLSSDFNNKALPGQTMIQLKEKELVNP
jgi:hypothetical protein